MSVKELILKASINLFNQQGTAKVTTNHIAKEAGISPGNLYYHYQAKAHIIREIYELMVRDWEKAYGNLEQVTALPEYFIKDFIKKNFELLWHYRFFYRESVALINADPLLSQRHIEVTHERINRQRSLIQEAVHQGLMRLPGPEVTLDDVLTMAWIVANHYLVHLEAMGRKVEQEDFKNGADLVMKIFHPYLFR